MVFLLKLSFMQARVFITSNSLFRNLADSQIWPVKCELKRFFIFLHVEARFEFLLNLVGRRERTFFFLTKENKMYTT